MIKKIKENIWEIEKEGKMKVPAIVFASDVLMDKIRHDKTVEQAKNVSMLPGIVEKMVVMSDAHQGYGFPIGGVAAFDLKQGVISPGGVGYDINCGVRLLSTNISKKEFMKKRKEFLSDLYKTIPSGVGEGNKQKLSDKDVDEILNKGSSWALENKYATQDDIEKTEDQGKIIGADASKVSQKAKARGRNQLGTIGAGNHFLEMQEVERIFDKRTAEIFGLHEDQIVIMIHTGSRGLGHQTASDYIHKMEKEYGIANLPDRELTYAPLDSKLGKEYQSAMAAAANFAFANRQVITHKIRELMKKYFSAETKVIYDIAHNIAKFEEFEIHGKSQTLCVHRKGATRSFGPGRKEIPKEYRNIGCPIFIPGSMGTFSYVLVGTKKAEEMSFASTAHGAGRALSRSYASKNISIESVKKDLESKDILLKAGSNKGIVEEAPQTYKDVNEVVRVSNELGLGMMVARLKPLAVVKG
ncbi:RtcB family protein [Candidatus Pacearchaeota archaeon]|nr:RtcB family protein [Candidatus Pacearchaeota archaeon]